MDELLACREEIQEIDRQMAELFERRMGVAKRIGAYKQKRGLAVRDKAREAKLIEKNKALIGEDDIRSYYVRFLQETIDLSVALQEKEMGGLKVAYGGVEGAYANIAAKKMFPGANFISKSDFEDAYKSVESGACDCAVLPIENSFAGEVGTVMDLMYTGSLFVNQVYDLPIRHRLLGLPGSSAEKIKTVISHPQALAQCSGYLSKHGMETISERNTSAAAQRLTELQDPTVGVIASEETAELFHLEILNSDIQKPGTNTTRFAVFSRVQNTPSETAKVEDAKFILVFTTKNEAGALASMLSTIGAHGYNMRNLKSRPLKSLPWNYYFYVEGEGNIHTKNGSDMMRELSVLGADIKLVGSYS